MFKQEYLNSCYFAFLDIRYSGPLVFHIMYDSPSDLDDIAWNRECSFGRWFVSKVDDDVFTIVLILDYLFGLEYKEARGGI